MKILASSLHSKPKYDKSKGISFRFYGLNPFSLGSLPVRKIISFIFNTLLTFSLIRVATPYVYTIVDFSSIKLSLATVMMISWFECVSIILIIMCAS